MTGGKYSTDGKGSPVIYSTADITVSDAELMSTAPQGVVVEGKNSVTLKNVILEACNSLKNSDKSDYYQAVMIYQSMSDDAEEGLASFSMEKGSIRNMNGDIFFVNNTNADISLQGSDIINDDENGIFLRVAAAGWGKEGSNGGNVDLNAEGQTINGDMLVDDFSTLNLYMNNRTDFNGAINTYGEAGKVYVEIADTSRWVLSGDSYITALSCETESIDLNGHTLYVNGEKYSEGTTSKGNPIEIKLNDNGTIGRSGKDETHGVGPGSTPSDGESGGYGGTLPDGGRSGSKEQPSDGGPGGHGGTRPDGKSGSVQSDES